jgi:hypothetical protein
MKIIKKKKFIIGAIAAITIFFTVGTVGALNGWFGGNNVPLDTFSRGLVGYWSFDEGNGTTAYDASGYANSGTLAGGTQWTTGKVGSGLSFDGVDDYVGVGNVASLDTLQQYTFEAWVNIPVVTSGNDRLMDKGTGNILYVWGVDGTIHAYRTRAGGEMIYGTNEVVSAGKWHHIVWVLSSTGDTPCVIYLDGLPCTYSVATPASGAFNSDSASDFILGGFAYRFSGLMDEVRIYNRALSAEEVRYHYNRSGPVAQWKFDEGSGSTAYDSMENSNDGVLYGEMASSTTGTSGWVSGKQGTALAFDGVNDYVDVGGSYSLSGNRTITAWIYPNTNTGLGSPILTGGAAGSGDFLGVAGTTGSCAVGTNELYIDHWGTSCYDSNIAVDANTWNHITIIYNNSNIYFYVNGIPGKVVANTMYDYNVNTYSIGGNTIGGSTTKTSFNGFIDDVRIYNYARTPAEITLDYNAGFGAKFGYANKSCQVDPGSCINKGLVGYWGLEERTGTTVYDSSDNGNNGIFVSGPQWTTGKVGSALEFDGVDDYVNLGNGQSLTNINSALTAEAWVYPRILAGIANWQNAVSQYGGGSSSWILRTSESNNGHFVPHVNVGGNWYNCDGGLLPLNTWSHILLTYDGEILTGYINGQYVCQNTGPSGSLAITGPTVIGGNYGGEFFNGAVDEVKVYNRVLSAEEIRYQYNKGGPVAYWKFDEGTGSAVYDSTKNGNNGTITGATWVTGKAGTALSFDGNDYVSISDSVDLSSANITVGAWVNPANTGNLGIAAKSNTCGGGLDNGWVFELMGGKLATWIYGVTPGWVSGDTVMPANQFSYVAFKYESGVVTFYVNGKLDKVIAVTNTSLPDNAVPLLIGSQGACNLFNGIIDDFRIYNYARTDEQIRKDYNEGFATQFGAANSECNQDPGKCITKGLIGYWNFSEGNGVTAYDGSGNNNTGTLTNGPQWTTGKVGSALEFDGANDYVDIADNSTVDLSTSFTLTAWVNPDSTDGNRAIIRKDSAYVLYYSSELDFYNWSDGTRLSCSKTKAPAGQWSYITAVWDGSKKYIYVNGVECVKESSVNFNINSADLSIGSQTDGAGQFFDGFIDEVRIYNRALSVEEIRYHYNKGGPVGYWKFNEGEGNTVYDSTDNNNDGNLILSGSATSSAWVKGKYGSALNFDGADDWVSIVDPGTASVLDVESGFSVCSWSRPQNTDERVIAEKGAWAGSWLHFLKPSGSLLKPALAASGWSPITLLGQTNISVGNWYHICTTWDGTTRKIYLNGVLDGYDNPTGSISANNGNLTIGGRSTGTYIFNGLIDEVRIYNYARTPSQIQQDYNAGLSTYFK